MKIRQSDESIKREWPNSNGTVPLPQEFGNVNKRSDFIQIGATDKIIHEVEKLLVSRNPFPGTIGKGEVGPSRARKGYP